MNPVRSLALCLLFIFAAAAIVAPGAYFLLHDCLPQPFHRYVDRALMVAALVGVGLFWRSFRIGSAREIGWARGGGGGFLLGLALGLGSAALVLGASLALGGRVLDGTISALALLGMIVGAGVLAVLEELLFRGVLQTLLVRGLGAVWGILTGALLFALLHFLKVPPDFAPEPVTAGSGWTAVGLAFTPFAHLDWAQPRLLLLAGVGLVLGIAAWRTGRLWLPIGLHAGWIVGLKLGNGLTTGVEGHWAAGDFSANPLSFAALLLIGIFVWRRPRVSST